MDRDVNAIGIVRQMVADGQVSQEVAEKYFPGLEESEGEWIRKWIIDELNDSLHTIEALYSGDYDYRDKDDIIREDCLRKAIAWFEKQGKKETDEWKEGNIIRRGGILALVIKGRRAMKSNGEIFTVQYPDGRLSMGYGLRRGR